MECSKVSRNPFLYRFELSTEEIFNDLRLGEGISDGEVEHSFASRFGLRDSNLGTVDRK